MSKIIQIDFSGNLFDFRDDGWFNATLAADKFGKRPVDWLALDSTQEYIESLREILKCEKSSLLKSKRGNNGGTWMHPKLAVAFARWLDVRFSIWCDSQIDSLIRDNQDWKKLRHESASSFKVMNAVLLLQRQMQGKVSAAHHFSNEARLINWALSGKFDGLDRNALAKEDLDLLAKLEERNAVLIGCGMKYHERKPILEHFVVEWRKPVALVSAA